LLEGAVFGGRHLRQHLAVQVNARLFQTGDEFAVGNVGRPARRVDAGDPQRAEIPLAAAPTDVAVTEGLLDRFLGGAVQPALGEKETGSGFQRLGAIGAPLRSSFDSRNGYVLRRPHSAAP
jgi:hypothetical protein